MKGSLDEATHLSTRENGSIPSKAHNGAGSRDLSYTPCSLDEDGLADKKHGQGINQGEHNAAYYQDSEGMHPCHNGVSHRRDNARHRACRAEFAHVLEQHKILTRCFQNLPDFYREDQALDRIHANHSRDGSHQTVMLGPEPETE